MMTFLREKNIFSHNMGKIGPWRSLRFFQQKLIFLFYVLFWAFFGLKTESGHSPATTKCLTYLESPTECYGTNSVLRLKIPKNVQNSIKTRKNPLLQENFSTFSMYQFSPFGLLIHFFPVKCHQIV
jgi:hypothetical protein